VPTALAPAVTSKNGTTKHKVTAHKTITNELNAVTPINELKSFSVAIMASRYFIVIFMPAGPTLNCVPDS